MNRIPAGMPATPAMLLAHLRCAVLFVASSGGVARASLTPGYKLPSLRDENAALGNSPFLLSSTGIVYNDQGVTGLVDCRAVGPQVCHVVFRDSRAIPRQFKAEVRKVRVWD